MSLLVMKFGGTSVADLGRLGHVAELIKSQRDQGHEVVVVLSAMSGETNRLLAPPSVVQRASRPDEETSSTPPCGLASLLGTSTGSCDRGSSVASSLSPPLSRHHCLEARLSRQ